MNKIQTSIMLQIVATAFAKKFDKAGEPYFNHCYTVAYMTKSDDEELRQIKLGHDLFEDTNITDEYLFSMGFSKRVVDGIHAMTKQRGQSYEAYKAQVCSNNDAILAKMDDLTHNSDIRRMKDNATQKDFERIQKYMAFYEQLKIVAMAKGLV